MASISAFGIVFAARTGGLATSRAIMRAPAVVLAGLSAAILLGGAMPIAHLDVGVSNLRSAKGLIRLCLTADPDNFPACVDDAKAMTRTVPAGTHAVRLDGLPHGDYAVAVIHDENSNAKLDTFAGIPREGFGFSRNPKITFGPPRFAAARFTIDGDAAQQQVRMRYFL